MGELSKRMVEAFKMAGGLPEAEQEEIADYLLNVLSSEIYVLSDDERAAIAEADAQIASGDLMPDAELAALYKKHGL